MFTDRKRIAKDLITHRSLWQNVLSDGKEEGKKRFVTLRELERSSRLNILYIGVKENNKAEFEKLTEAWNLLSVQFSQNVEAASDELIAELWVE